MPREPQVYLWDIAQAIEAIERFTMNLTLQEYLDSEITQAAIERKFEIIGEAVNQLSKNKPKLVKRIPHASETVGFRNVLIHGYATIDSKIVWQTIQTSLPALKQAIARELASLDRE